MMELCKAFTHHDRVVAPTVTHYPKLWGDPSANSGKSLCSFRHHRLVDRDCSMFPMRRKTQSTLPRSPLQMDPSGPEERKGKGEGKPSGHRQAGIASARRRRSGLGQDVGSPRCRTAPRIFLQTTRDGYKPRGGLRQHQQFHQRRHSSFGKWLFYRDCDHHLMKLLTWAIANCRAGRKHDRERGGVSGIRKIPDGAF